jgi:hypothetical protein
LGDLGYCPPSSHRTAARELSAVCWQQGIHDSLRPKPQRRAAVAEGLELLRVLPRAERERERETNEQQRWLTGLCATMRFREISQHAARRCCASCPVFCLPSSPSWPMRGMLSGLCLVRVKEAALFSVFTASKFVQKNTCCCEVYTWSCRARMHARCYSAEAQWRLWPAER